MHVVLYSQSEFSEISRDAGGGRSISPPGINPVWLCTALPLCVFPTLSSPLSSHTHWQKWAVPAVTDCTRSVAGQQLPPLLCSRFTFPSTWGAFWRSQSKLHGLEVFLDRVLHAYQRCKEPAAGALGSGVLPHLAALGFWWRRRMPWKQSTSLAPQDLALMNPWCFASCLLLLPSIMHSARAFNLVIILSLGEACTPAPVISSTMCSVCVVDLQVLYLDVFVIKYLRCPVEASDSPLMDSRQPPHWPIVQLFTSCTLNHLLY